MTQVTAASEMQLNEENAVKTEIAAFQQLNQNENNILFFSLQETFGTKECIWLILHGERGTGITPMLLLN